MYKKATYYEDDDVRVRVELVNDELFAHVTIFNAKKSVVERLLKVWAEIKALAYFDGYEAIYTYTQDAKRMQKLFPFSQKVGPFEWEGRKFEVLKWDLN
jgi:hypothetical protein